MPDNILETDDQLRYRIGKRYDKRKEFFIHAAVYITLVGATWAFWLFGGYGQGLVPLVITMLWGAGLGVHALDTYFQVGAAATNADGETWREMRRLYGDDWRIDASAEEYATIRHRMTRPLNQRKELSMHALVYFMVNLTFWLLWLSTSSLRTGFPLPLLFSGAWGLGLTAHVIEVLFNTRRDGLIDREIERERERMEREVGMSRKRKNDERVLRLSDDGELFEFDDDEDVIELPIKRKRR
jgi:hypothetical protein